MLRCIVLLIALFSCPFLSAFTITRVTAAISATTAVSEERTVTALLYAEPSDSLHKTENSQVIKHLLSKEYVKYQEGLRKRLRFMSC